MVKVTEFMTAIIGVSLIVALFGLYIANVYDNYGRDNAVEYDNASLEVYNQLDEMSILAQDLEESSEIEERTGVLDVIGGFFSSGYNALKLTKQSFNTFDTMSNQAIDDANLGQAGKYLRIAVSSIILILIVVGVIIAAIVKRDL